MMKPTAVAVPEPSAAHPGPTRGLPGKSRSRENPDPAGFADRIRAALASPDATRQPDLVARLLAEWVEADPQAAARFAETSDIAGDHAWILHRVAQLWAERDTQAALAWAGSLPEPGEKDAMLTDVCLQLSATDPAEAVRTLAQQIPGENPHGGLEVLAQRWAEHDFTAARDWALSRPDGWRRDRLIARLAQSQAQQAPRDAAALVADEITEGATQTEAVLAVLHQWAIQDAAAATEWIELFPDSGVRTRAFAEIDGIARYRSQSDH